MKLSDILHEPSHWSHQNDEVIEVELSSGSYEYRAVKSKLTGDALKHLKRITRVQNPFLYYRYKLRKLEYETLGISFKERDLVHATAESKIPSIIKDNLDWRLISRAKFGKGVSFSSCTQYANRQCSYFNGTQRAMIIAKVLVGNEYPGDFSTNIPPKGFDTTYGNGDYVIVKYYDDEFYPEYVAYYNDL